MKLLESAMNKVNFHGILLYIPRSMPHVAVNKDGNIWCYDHKPYFLDGETEFDIDDGDQLRLGKVDLDGFDWEKSLVSY